MWILLHISSQVFDYSICTTVLWELFDIHFKSCKYYKVAETSSQSVRHYVSMPSSERIKNLL